MQVAFIGHRKIEKTEQIKRVVAKVVTQLIKDGADTFLFGSKSAFDDLCLDVVTELKLKHPHVRRIYVRAAYKYIDEPYTDYLLSLYDETFFPDNVSGAGYRSYVKRNQAMIDACDVLVAYFDKDYRLSAGRTSGTKLAVEYAQKKKKQIINLCE